MIVYGSESRRSRKNNPSINKIFFIHLNLDINVFFLVHTSDNILKFTEFQVFPQYVRFWNLDYALSGIKILVKTLRTWFQKKISKSLLYKFFYYF